MTKKEYFIDDRVIIPEEIKHMTKEQLEAEIAKFELEVAERKRILENKKKNDINFIPAYLYVGYE